MANGPDNEPFYSPTKKPAPPREPKPGEPLFEFLHGHDRVLCEPRDHGEFGVEARFYFNGIRTRREYRLQGCAERPDGRQRGFLGWLHWDVDKHNAATTQDLSENPNLLQQAAGVMLTGLFGAREGHSS